MMNLFRFQPLVDLVARVVLSMICFPDDFGSRRSQPAFRNRILAAILTAHLLFQTVQIPK